MYVFCIVNVEFLKVNVFICKAQIPFLHNCARYTNVIFMEASLTKKNADTSIFYIRNYFQEN